jgi:putative oxidoreductase
MNRTIKRLLFGGPGSSKVGDVGLLVLRIGAGGMMAIGHGMGKVIGDGRFGPPPEFVEGLAKMNVPAPTLAAWCAALAEFLGGALLAIGLLTRPAALALTINMAVAAFVAHATAPWFMSGTGPAKEPALLFLVPFIALLLMGPGRYSIDRAIAGRSGEARGFDAA